MSSINSKEHYQRHNSSKAIGQNVLLSTLLLRQRSSNCMSRNNTSINSANVSISSRNSSENVNNSNNHGSNNHHTHHVVANHVLPEIRSSLAENDAECDKDKKESKSKRKSKNTKVNSPNSNSTITQSESSANSSVTSSTRVKNLSSNSTNSDSGVPHRSELKPLESARNKTLIAVTPTISTPSTTPTLITISPSPPLRQGENYKMSNGSNSSNSCSHTPMTKLTRANMKMDLHQTQQVQEKKNEEEEQQQEKEEEKLIKKEQQKEEKSKKEQEEQKEKPISSEKEKVIREENVPTHLTSQNAKNTITNNYNNFSKFKRNSNLATSPKAILSTNTNTKLISPTKNVNLNSAPDKANSDEKNRMESMTNVKIHTPRHRTSESSNNNNNNNNNNLLQQGQNGNKAENTERGHVSNTRQLKARESNRVAFIVESNDVGTINEGSNHNNNKEHEQRLRPIRRTSNDHNINAEFGVHLSRRAIYIIQKINNIMRKCTSFRGPKASESEEHLFEALSALHNSTLGTLYINHPEVTFASRSCVLLMEPFHRDEMINGYRLVGYFTPGTVGRSYFAVKEETTISSLKTLSSTSSSMVVVSPNLPETQLLRRESNRANDDKDGIYTTNTNNDNINTINNSSTKNKNREKEGESTAKSTVANTVLSPQLINGTKANINMNSNKNNNNNCTMNSPMSTMTTAPFDSSKSESEMRNVETPLSVRMNKKTDNNTSFVNNTSSSNSGSNSNNNNSNTNPNNACVDGVSLTSTTASSSNVDVDASFIFKNVSFVLRPHLLEPVMAEQRVLVNINYDNIAKIWDVLCDDVHENLLIVTAMHRNGNIARYAGKLNDEPEKLRRILREVGIGLRIIHSHKIYHHNLKLENVLEIGENRYCIADAGFARLFASQCPEALVFNGELASLPPEVFDENGHYAIVHPGEDEYEEYVHYQKCYGSTFANYNNYNSSNSGNTTSNSNSISSGSNNNSTMTTNSPTSTNNTTIHGFCSSGSSSSVIPFNYQHVAMVDM